MVETFWKPKKASKIKFNDGLKIKGMTPKKNSWFGDVDRDGVVNIFDCKPHNKRQQGWAHQGHTMNRERTTHVVMMTPQKFMRTTYKEAQKKGINFKIQHPHQTYKNIQEYSKDVIDPTNVQRLKNVIRSRQGKMEIPYLEYDTQGYPTGHEGRHRATASMEMGVKRIPVTVARELPSKEYRDWQSQRERVGAEKNWRRELEHEEEITSSKSADIPIQEQREYGEEKPEVLQSLPESTAQELIDEAGEESK